MKVLLPIDGSDNADEAIGFVQSLAEDNTVDVTIMHVTYDPTGYALQPWLAEWSEQENQRSKAILDQAQTDLDASCNSTSIVHGSGAIVPCILEESKKSQADLIVIGAKGHSAIGRLLLGSVSDSVASRAECSVVVVRPQSDTSQPAKIVLGFDRSRASREAVAEMLELNWQSDTRVEVVSVVLNPYVFVGEGYMANPMTVTPEQIAPITETAERMSSRLADTFPHTTSRIQIADHVGEAIVQAAESDNADLIIVGDSEHSRLGNFLLGSTSKYVLRHAPCSVWISRHHWKSSESNDSA
ncbi:universal stress protein [Rubripirellula amarantea]|uniref:Universal stress protein n=1 Tax=Rubripirellula amarantea TaxID=2527999 RepID=A0A5C5WFT0_9BACT|nr:universal stress protein [Rubripirellula amarantea]MDA8743896.1 universal stress protein [Rubripirellula amarantea]TWT49614.1 Universal stress protein [Rubripirellula amarantea]